MVFLLPVAAEKNLLSFEDVYVNIKYTPQQTTLNHSWKLDQTQNFDLNNNK